MATRDILNYIFIQFIIIVCTMPFHISLAQNIEKPTDQYLNTVVRITAEFHGRDTDHGFGFVVGEQDNKLYIVTANHVVRKDDPDNNSNVFVEFYNDKGKLYKSHLLNLIYPSIDLALVEVKKPSQNFSWNQTIDSKVSQGEKVWFIGRSKEWYSPYTHGYIQEIPVKGEFQVEINGVLPGTSGAPMISEDGIIGMIVKSSQLDVTVLDIATIKKIVNQIWNKPWGKMDKEQRAPEVSITKDSIESKKEIPAQYRDIFEYTEDIFYNRSKLTWDQQQLKRKEVIDRYISEGYINKIEIDQPTDEKQTIKLYVTKKFLCLTSSKQEIASKLMWAYYIVRIDNKKNIENIKKYDLFLSFISSKTGRSLGYYKFDEYTSTHLLWNISTATNKAKLCEGITVKPY